MKSRIQVVYLEDMCSLNKYRTVNKMISYPGDGHPGILESLKPLILG